MKPHQIIKTRKNKKNHTKESKQEKIKKPHKRIKINDGNILKNR